MAKKSDKKAVAPAVAKATPSKAAAAKPVKSAKANVCYLALLHVLFYLRFT